MAPRFVSTIVSSRSAGWSAAAAAIIVAAVALTMVMTPPASAMSVSAGASQPVVGTGCTYRVSQPVFSAVAVTLVETTAEGTGAVQVGAPVRPRQGVASFLWRPSVSGPRVLTAHQGAATSAPVRLVVRDGSGVLCRSRWEPTTD